jgi:RNA polymerase sigma-70 factor (ECF subfamily)
MPADASLPPPADIPRPGGVAETARTDAPAPRPRDSVFSEPGAESGPVETLDDAVLVQRVLRGERELFHVLVERHQHHVYRLALRLSNGDRERSNDLAQDAFLHAFRGLVGFSFDAKFGTWLHRVTVNVAISQKRRERAVKRGSAVSLDAPRQRDDPESTPQVAVKGPSPVDDVTGEEARRAVTEAIASLDEDLRVLVVLVNLEEHSYEEAADMLGIPIGTVRSRLHRARAVLEQRLRPFLRNRD